MLPFKNEGSIYNVTTRKTVVEEVDDYLYFVQEKNCFD